MRAGDHCPWSCGSASLAGVSLRRGQAIVTLEFGSASLISEVSQSFAAQPTHEIHELGRRSRCTQWDNRHGGRESLGTVNWPSFWTRTTPPSEQPDHGAADLLWDGDRRSARAGVG